MLKYINEESQQDVIESVNKPFKENIPQDVGELSSKEKEGKMEVELIEKEEEEEEEEEECDPDVVPFINQKKNLQRQS